MQQPSRSYFPTTLAQQALWMANFSFNFQAVGGGLGFTAPQIASVVADNEDFQFCVSATTAVDLYGKAVRQYRITMTQGNTGDPNPAFPADPSLAPPNQVPAGLFERIDTLVKQIRLAPTSTPEIGALLGILPVSPDRPPVSELKPEITVGEAIAPYSFTMKATRFGLPVYQVQVQRSGSSDWENNSQSSTSTHTVNVTPTTPGQPERVLVRAILLQNGEPVGIPSNPSYVTVNP